MFAPIIPNAAGSQSSERGLMLANPVDRPPTGAEVTEGKEMGEVAKAREAMALQSQDSSPLGPRRQSRRRA